MHPIRHRNNFYLCIVWIVVWYQQLNYIVSEDSSSSSSSSSNLTISPTPSPSISSNTSQLIPTTTSLIPLSTPPTSTPSTILQPTQLPTIQEVTFSPLTLEPTKNLITVTSPPLSMTLINMEQNILTNNETRRQFRNLTSQHVRQYWNLTSQQYNTPFFIGRVVTSILSETRTPIIPPQEPFIVNSVMIQPTNSSLNESIYNSFELPDRLEIVYVQEITYLEMPSGDASFFNFQVSDIFTIPFVQDGSTFTTNVRSMTFNNYIIFLDYTGVVVEDPPTIPVLSDPRNRKLIISVVTAVVSVLMMASLYIYCVLKRRPKIEHDIIQQHNGIDEQRNGPDLLIPMNQSGELPLLIPPPTTATMTTTMVAGVQQQQQQHSNNSNHHPTASNNNENVIVSECYDEEYPHQDVSTTNQSLTEDALMHKENIATAIDQSLLTSFLPPLSSMESRHISNITEPTSWGSDHVKNNKSSTYIDRGSPLRITATNSRDFDSEQFMLNPSNHELNHQVQHQSLMIGTPSRYGMVTTAIPSTVSDLDMNETPLLSDFQDSPFRRNSEDNVMHAGTTGGGYEGFGGSNHNNNSTYPDYIQPPSQLGLGLPVLGNSGDDNMSDLHNHHQQHYYNHYPHEPDAQIQQRHDVYHDNAPSYDENRNMPMMTGFQLEIQDLD